MDIGNQLYIEEPHRIFRGRDGRKAALLFLFCITIGGSVGVASFYHEDTPLWVPFIFPTCFVFMWLMYGIDYLGDRKGLKVYENAIVFPSLFKGREQIVPFSQIEVLYWNPNGPFIEFLMKQHDVRRKKMINVMFLFEKDRIYDAERFREILKMKIKVIEDVDLKREDLEKWERGTK